jgi:hypothetical protein
MEVMDCVLNLVMPKDIISGNINVRFENLITSERGYPDYLKQNIYNIQWSHSKDSKANPNSSFSASVNLGSSKYLSNLLIKSI